MVEEIYVQLSKAYYEAFGAPAYGFTESKYLPRILEMCLTEEQAAILLSLPGTPEEVAAKLGKEVSHVAKMLKDLFAKGFNVYEYENENRRRYRLPMELLFGIDAVYYKSALGPLAEEWLDLWDRCYEEETVHFGWYGAPEGKPQMRIIPVEKTITMKYGEILPYEQASRIIKDAKSITVIDCYCRTYSRRCDNPLNVCICLDEEADYFLERGALNVRKISKEEALSILERCEDLGLVHQINNAPPEGYQFLCNCCSCCCTILRGFKILGKKNASVKSRYISSVNTELCDGCSGHASPICVQRCNFGAMDIVDSKAVVDEEKCFGCGLCASKCPPSAIQLIQVRGPEHITDHFLEPSDTTYQI